MVLKQSTAVDVNTAICKILFAMNGKLQRQQKALSERYILVSKVQQT